MKRFLFASFFFAMGAFCQQAATTKPIVFEIPKMFCASCTTRVKQVIESCKGTSDIQVTLDDKSARFNCDVAAGCDLEKIKKGLIRIQYPAKER